MGRYRLGRVIGHGGMSMVYEAWKLLPDGTACPVAIKRIMPRHGRDSAFVRSFHREARLCLDMSHDHPNLVTVFDLDQDEEGRLFLVMERVDGVNLDELVSVVALPFTVVRRILVEVLEGLAHAHGHGVVHRDISLRNILLSRTGEVKISDFGLARALDGERSESGFQGTAAYASPEAIQGAEVDARADLYSLAAILYRVLAGSPPFGHGQWIQINRRMAEWRIPPLAEDVPEDLRVIIKGLLEYAPEERAFQSADAALESLEAHGAPVATAADLAALIEEACQKRAFVEGASEHALSGVAASAPALEPAEIPFDAAAPGYGGTSRKEAVTARSRRLWFALGFGMGLLVLGGPDLRPPGEVADEHTAYQRAEAAGEAGTRCEPRLERGDDLECPLPDTCAWSPSHTGGAGMPDIEARTPALAGAVQERATRAQLGDSRQISSPSRQAHAPGRAPDGRAPGAEPTEGLDASMPSPPRKDAEALVMEDAKALMLDVP